jgi:hypothetical protein
MKKFGYWIDVQQVGDERWPRWAIKDSRRRWYTGDGWINDPKRAFLYSDEAEAKEACSRCRDDIPSRRFFLPVKIVVNANSDFTLDDLMDYLSRNLRLYLDDDGGEHPCDDAAYDLKFFWNELEESG